MLVATRGSFAVTVGCSRAAAVAVVLTAASGTAAAAQTHYYNLDAGRPTRVEDAIPTERYGLDVHLAALRLERLDDGTYRWRGEPKLSYGLLPMTSLELRAPIVHVVRPRARGRGTTALGGVGLGALRAINVERTRVPGLAVAAEALLPVGGFSSGRASYTLQMLATKTTPALRTHVNASIGTYGVRAPRRVPSTGACPPGFFRTEDGTCQEFPHVPCALLPGGGNGNDPPPLAAAPRCGALARERRQVVVPGSSGFRWAVGIGADRSFPFQSMLVTADLFAERFIGLYPQTDWTAEIGLRRQWSPQILLDLGVARQFAGVTRSSSVMLGITYSFASRATRSPAVVAADVRDPSATGPFEQTYLPARHNWMFRGRYPRAERLLNAFDYGHAILYETLIDRPTVDDAGRRLDGPVYDHVVGRVLRRPPRLALEERAIGPRYATLVPELLAMFEWAHLLHRQLYDVFADARLSAEQRQARAGEVLRYYQSRRDLALSAAPKSMDMMEGQPYSLAFRRAAPKFNGLIWSYHWLQIALYEALLAGAHAADRRANLDASVDRFWAMLDSTPARLPTVMPMSPAIAPRFSEQYAEAAVIFDNLHSLHDVAADILASPLIPQRDKRAAILKAAAAYRDSTTAVVSRDEWRRHSEHMGVEQMGGPAPVGTPVGVAPAPLPHARH